MENLDNIRALAETAIESKNFDQAYQYYSKLLENNSNEYSYWLGKGISAGWCSTPSNPRFDELVVCIKQALKNDSNSQLNKEQTSIKILFLCEEKLKDVFTTIDKEVTDEFDKKPMGTGELYAVHQTAKLPIQLKTGNKYSPTLIKIIDAMEFGCQINPNSDGFTRTIVSIDKIFQHSLDHTDYFKIHKEAGDRFDKLVQRRQSLIQKAKLLDSNFTVGFQPQSKSSGCFIATAVLGDYQHPYVLLFRKYRDEILEANLFGRLFIYSYYKISPPFAILLSKNYSARNLVLKLFIRPLYIVLSKILNNSIK
jgi:hypothetical protein